MAGNGSMSGDGKTSPFGPADGGKPAGGNDFMKNPAGTSSGNGNDFIANPSGTGDKSGGNDFIANPGGNMATPTQQKGSYENKESVPEGGKLPFVKGGAEPSTVRTDPKSGFAVGSAPGGPNRKPYKLTGR
jgi:hypothetical protein